MKKISLFLATVASTFVFSQFVSPGTGITYNLASLSAAAPGVLVNTGSAYLMTANITISEGDELVMSEDTTLRIDGGVQLTVAGNYSTTANQVLITASNPANVFRGIRLESTSNVSIKNTTLEYGGGIQVFTGNFLMDNSTVQYFKSGLVNSAAINFSTGKPVVTNSKFIENDLAAVGSGANLSVALTFTNNLLERNTKGNSNRPQINMGPSGSGATTIIRNNTIIGNPANDKVGGVSVSSLLGVPNTVIIEGNTIRDNRFGITVAGNSTATISGNTLTDNNKESNPNNGGSGINLNGSGTFKVEGNKISGHLWGITLVGNVTADLGGGTLGSTGNNIFKNNGNGGVVYALYNNTPNNVSAQNNCWREGELSDEVMVDEVIVHRADTGTLGTVDYSNYLCAKPLATDNSTLLKSSIYPNPSNGTFVFDSEKAGKIAITDMSGKNIYSGNVNKGKNTVSVKTTAGIYILRYSSEGKTSTNKLIIK